MTIERCTDQPNRDIIARNLDQVIFVRAGAGTGKTTSLVARIITLIESGSIEITKLAAITFTDRAANELRVRIRSELLRRAEDQSSHTLRLNRALEMLPSAPIGTIHSLGVTLLQEFGAIIGLPMGFRIINELEASILSEKEWKRFSDELYDDPEFRDVLELSADFGVDVAKFQALAMELDDIAHPNHGLLGIPQIDIKKSLREFVEISLEIAQEMASVFLGDSDMLDALNKGDLLAIRITKIEAFAKKMIIDIGERGANGALLALSSQVHPKMPSLKVSKLGSKVNWLNAQALAQARSSIAEFATQLDSCVSKLNDDVSYFLLSRFEKFVESIRATRKSSGRINFDDLIRLSLELLRQADPSILKAIRSRFSVVLVDEFQDTDPIQIEIVQRISGCVDDYRVPNRDAIAPLFFVGDPRQSIYRFRGADIDSYLGVARSFESDPEIPDIVDLVDNFRSNSDITDWVNAVFEGAFKEVSQLDTGRIRGVRAPMQGCDSVRLLSINGSKGLDSKVQNMRTLEAELCVNAVLDLLHTKTMVAVGEIQRPVELADIAIIVPTRAILPELFKYLDRSGIQYVAGASLPIYEDELIRELFLVLSASCSPHDGLEVIHALSTSLLAVSTQDIVEATRGYRSFDAMLAAVRDLPISAMGESMTIVSQALQLLDEIWATDLKMGCYEAVKFGVKRLGLYERSASSKSMDETWRRLDFVLDEAQQWVNNANVTLRSYVDFVKKRVEERAKLNESQGGDLGVDALTILTVHAAKGLEFPVVIMTGNSDAIVKNSSNRSIAQSNEQIAIKIGSNFQTANFSECVERERMKDRQEKLRLLYVGATRARDHLLITFPVVEEEIQGWRDLKYGPGEALAKSKMLWHLLANLTTTQLTQIDDRIPEVVPIRPSERREQIDFETWNSARQKLIRSIDVPRVITATAMMASEELSYQTSRPRPSTTLGISGRDVGILVHACLAEVSLHDVDQAMIQTNEILGTRGLDRSAVDYISQVVRCALQADCVRNAVSPLREFVVSAALDDGDIVVESVIDLGYDAGGVYRIVDYKVVDEIIDSEIQSRMDRYLIQGSLYKYAMQRLLSQDKVIEVIFLFVSATDYREIICNCLSIVEVEQRLRLESLSVEGVN